MCRHDGRKDSCGPDRVEGYRGRLGALEIDARSTNSV